MTTTSTKPATWFWVVSVLALIWNLLGVGAYISQVTMSPEAIQALPDDQRAILESTPAWATGAFAVAVWGGALGSVLLLFRKSAARGVFVVSFVGIVVQMIHSIFMTNSIDVYGPGGMVMPVLVLVFGAYLIWFAGQSRAKGWLA